MSYAKTTSYSGKSIKIVENLMDERQLCFSEAVNYLISTADYLKTKVDSLRKQQEIVREHEEKPIH